MYIWCCCFSGKTGAIQHILSSRCIAPVKYDLLHPPAEIDLQFTSACVGDQALFTTLESGLIVHNVRLFFFAVECMDIVFKILVCQ